VVQRALKRRKTWARGTLASRDSRADPHYHIVTTYEAKESGTWCAGAKSWHFQAVGVVVEGVGGLERIYLRQGTLR
jgi:hypothetical protein